MKNNNGLGLYEIGERINLPCGCVVVAEEIGYVHYVNPNCKADNTLHPLLASYRYEMMPPDARDSENLRLGLEA